MSEANQEAAIFIVGTVILIVLFVVGVRRKNPWRTAAPICMVMTLTLVWFNLHGYVFGGPGLTIQPPPGR
jgi:hypothetical protein